MLTQAQDFLITAPIPFEQPIAVLLVLTMLAVLASGVLFESGLPSVVRSWLGGGSARLPRPVAPAGHRG